MKNTMVIINPKQKGKKVKKLINLLKENDFNTIFICKDKYELKTVAKFFYQNQNYNYLLIWGGDGTVHKVVNYLTKISNKSTSNVTKAIGFLKGGSGNGIQESYEVKGFLKKQIIDYKESIINNFIIATDLIKVKTKEFVKYTQLIGLGLDADILYERKNNKYRFGKYKGKTKKGFLNYFFSAIKVFFFTKSFLKDFIINFYKGDYLFFGTRVNAKKSFKKLVREIKAPLIEIGTRSYYGNMFKICPYVICNDGFMDAYIFGFKKKIDLFLNIFDLYLGRHHSINKKNEKSNKALIEHYKVKKIKIKLVSDINIHIDGEFFKCSGTKENPYAIKLKIIPEKLNIIVPSHYYKKFHPF